MLKGTAFAAASWQRRGTAEPGTVRARHGACQKPAARYFLAETLLVGLSSEPCHPSQGHQSVTPGEDRPHGTLHG